ncbi:hypothetical protein [Nonomuraea sp. NPDC049625]|uniref:hypothetical protein n=1 Tax=Nonomuraea sp. NPDC049625 TaxID=3155775 RepID=UPI0034455429
MLFSISRASATWALTTPVDHQLLQDAANVDGAVPFRSFVLAGIPVASTSVMSLCDRSGWTNAIRIDMISNGVDSANVGEEGLPVWYSGVVL